MSATVVLMNTEELLALPDNGTERDLIRGELRERPMTKRNRFHSSIEARIAHFLLDWVMQQPPPRGNVHSGEVGCILRHNPDTTVGIDVAYFSADVEAQQSTHTTMMDGAPVIAVEILSPTDKEEEINEKIDEYLEANVELVWIVDPHYRTVRVHRPGAQPELFNINQELTADPHLPGFRVRVAAIFE
jgi:Uma2 family endonuclease